MTEKTKRERPNTIALFRAHTRHEWRIPPRLPEPLMLLREDELRINPKHWAAWPARLLYALLVPLLILMNVASIAHSW